jgi:hypothetical protein
MRLNLGNLLHGKCAAQQQCILRLLANFVDLNIGPTSWSIMPIRCSRVRVLITPCEWSVYSELCADAEHSLPTISCTRSAYSITMSAHEFHTWGLYAQASQRQ